MTKWKQLCFILSTEFLKLQTYLNCHFPISCINHLKTLITIFLVLASVHKCQTGFSLANIHLPRMKMHLGRLSSKVIDSKIWSQDISEEMRFILLCSFSKTIPKWPVILPKVLLIFIWYAVNYLYYCFEYFFGFYIFYLSVAYLLSHQLLIPPYLVYRHAYVVFICLIWLCLHAFWCFHYFFH